MAGAGGGRVSHRATDVREATWTGTGQCVVALVRARAGAALPDGLHPLPGPTLVVAANYETSPVGPYLELAVGRPARAGASVGMCSTTMIVDSAGSRAAGRERWGFPKELGTLQWSVDGEERTLRWEERGIVVRGRPVGPGFPAFVPYQSVQRRADGPVRVSGRLRGWGRLTRVEMVVPADDPWAGLAGRHGGVTVSRAQVAMGPARATR